jgi:hypothetical protein
MRNVALGILDHQVQVPPFIHVVEKRESSGEKQHPDSGEQAEADYPPKFMGT